MLRKNITIINKLGLHARAASKLVSLASSFKSEIELEKQGQRINGKSIMGVMMLAASQGTQIDLIIDGSDEQAAFAQIQTLIDSRFGENE